MGVTNRLKTDKNSGKVFFPMNVEGGVEDGFFTPLKLIVTVIFGLAVLIDFLSLSDSNASSTKWLIHIAILLFVGQLALRYVLLNERYYFRMYKRLMQNKVTTPEILWEIVNIQDYDDGSIIIYGDMKLGVMIKMERDTIIGRDSDFKETHYDAVSEFFKELNLKELFWVKLDIMENAEKDKRLQCLDDTVIGCENKNIAKLAEMHLGYLKSIARNTLYESEYYLIYTKRSNRMDTLLSDVNECAYKLLDGAYSKYTILKADDIYQMPAELYGTKYFNAQRAMLRVFSKSGIVNEKTFEIIGITLNNGTELEIKEKENLVIEKLASYKKAGKLVAGKWTITEALSGNINKLFDSDIKAEGKKKVGNIEDTEQFTGDNKFIDSNTGDNVVEDIDAVAKQLRNKAGKINSEIQADKDTITSENSINNAYNINGVNADTNEDDNFIEDDEIVDYDSNTDDTDANFINDNEVAEVNSDIPNSNKSNDSGKKEDKDKKKTKGSIFKKKEKKKETESIKFNAEDIQNDMLEEYNKR